MEIKNNGLLVFLLSLTLLILFSLSSVQPTAAQDPFESCEVQNGRDSNGDPHPNSIPVSECNALVSFYYSTGGPNWNVSLGWFERSPCFWAGVVCSQLYPEAEEEWSRVTSLTFSNNQLSGNIPPTINNLPNLTGISLSNNQLSGSIPSTIGDLTNLQGLSLSNNQLSGSIPSTIGNLTNLTSIGLYHNQLSGSIPSSIGSMASLKILSLNDNQLSGSIPSTIGNLDTLISFTSGNNPLSGELPLSMINLGSDFTGNIYGTCLVEPSDPIFQDWLDSISFVPNLTPHPDCYCLVPSENKRGTSIPIPDWCPVANIASCLDLRDFNGDGTSDCLLSELEDDKENTIQLWCMETLRTPPRPSFFWYGLIHISQGGGIALAGQCPFLDGRNDGIVIHSGDNDASGKPDCFLSTKWTSIDLGDDDDDDGKLDWWVYQYDIDSMTLNSTNFELGSVTSGGTKPDLTVAKPTPFVTHLALDNLGLSFNDIPPVLDLDNLPEGGPMMGEDRDLCDLDRDGDCDAIDVGIFDEAYFTCVDEVGYHPDADANGDGCVSLSDQQLMFSESPEQYLIFLPIILKN